METSSLGAGISKVQSEKGGEVGCVHVQQKLLDIASEPAQQIFCVPCAGPVRPSGLGEGLAVIWVL